jgi:hypothetical protein
MNQSSRKDPRISFVRHRLAYGGNVWFVTAKADPRTKTLKVTRIEGDITNNDLLCEALQSLANEAGQKLATRV